MGDDEEDGLILKNDCERMHLTEGDDWYKGGTRRDVVGFDESSPKMEIGQRPEPCKTVVTPIQ